MTTTILPEYGCSASRLVRELFRGKEKDDHKSAKVLKVSQYCAVSAQRLTTATTGVATSLRNNLFSKTKLLKNLPTRCAVFRRISNYLKPVAIDQSNRVRNGGENI